MRYLLDGYNLAHWLVRDDDARPEQLRARLLAVLQGRLPANARDVVIYWDVRGGSASLMDGESLPWCRMRYVPSADEAIVDAVHDAENPRDVTVVSRDREVTGRSRQLGARILTPAEFLPR